MEILQLRGDLEMGLRQAAKAIDRGRLEKARVGALVQLASEYAHAARVPHVDLTGVPWNLKPDAIGAWLRTLA